MFNIKKNILNLAVLAAALYAADVSAQGPAATSEVLASGSTLYLASTPGVWQNEEWNMEGNIAQDAAGNIYVAGTYYYDGFDNDVYIRKINPVTGSVVWTSTIAHTGQDYARGVAVDGLGAVYVLAMVTESDVNQMAVAKLNAATGQVVWGFRYYDSTNGNNAYDLVADNTGAYVAGTTGSKIAIVKFPADGVAAIAPYNFPGGSYSSAYSIAFASGTTQLVVAGTMNLENEYGNEIWLGKFRKSDMLHLWASTYAPAANHQYWGYDEAHAVQTDSAGNIYVAGFYQTQDSGQDIWLGKYDSSGNLMYARTKNGFSNGYDKGFGLALDPQGNVYVTGKIEAYTLGQDINLWLGKYSPSGAMVSEILVNRNSEVGYDVEVTSAMVCVGGGFQEQYGLLAVSPSQFGAPQQLFAGPGAYTGSVNLSWVFETDDTFDYKIQYATSASIAWNMADAQVDVQDFTVAAAGERRNHQIMGLPTIVSNTAGVVGTAGPVYYFKVWTSTGAGWTAMNVANSAPNAPYNYWMQNDQGQDSFYVFNSARGPAVSTARDTAGNTFAAYAAGYNMKQGLALVKVDPYGVLQWTSFYNSTSSVADNGRFHAMRMAVDGSGNIYVAGAAELEYSANGEEAWLAKFNSAGVLLWDKVLTGEVPASDDRFMALALDGSGNVYAAGAFIGAGGGAEDMLIAKYSADGTLLSSSTFNYNPAGEENSPTEIWSLALDGNTAVYAGGYITPVSADTRQSAVIIKLNSSLVFQSSHAYVNAVADADDGIGDLALSAGYLYASGIKSDGAVPSFWVAKLNPANWATPLWQSTHSVDGLPAAALGLKVNSGNLYVAGYETRLYPPDNNKNMLLRKYDMTTGTVGWTKSVDGTYQNENVQAVGVEVGADGYFYVSGLFNMWGSDDDGQPGVARLAEPMSGIVAMPGYKPCSVQLGLVAPDYLPAGTTFYVYYSTVSGVASSTYSFFNDYDTFSGSYLNHLVPGLEAGNGVPGPNYMDSPKYYFTMGYKRPGDPGITEIAGSTNAYANTPGSWDRMDRYPNGNLFVLNNFHGDRFPLLRDAAGNIYTAGSFSPWGGNSNTAYVRKFSATGQPLWTRYYSDEYNNSFPVISALALDMYGNLYAAGTQGSDSISYNPPYLPESATKKDILLIKYNSSGRMLWQRSYDISGGNDYAYGLALTLGDVIVVGKTASSPGNDDAFVAALNTNGDMLDVYTLDGNSDWDEDMFNAVAYDNANDRLFAAGRVNNGSDYDAVIKVLSFDGNSLTEDDEIVVDKGYEDELYAVKVDTLTAAVYLAGAVDGGMGTQDAYLAKYDGADLAGGPVWEELYNSANQNTDEAYGLALDGQGGVYLSGSEYRYDLNQGKNIFVRKYNEDGVFIWSQVLNSAGNNEDTAGGIAADAFRNVFVAVDASQMGAIAGGAYAPGTFNTGNTANTVNTINGAGYFRHMQSLMTTTNPRLTVRVANPAGVGLDGVAVAVMSFNQTGGMDPNGIFLGTTTSGAVTMALPSGRSYFIAISSHNMVPTISEQISDPYGNFFVELNADTTKYYVISPRQAAAGPVHKMNISVSSLTVNEFVMGEVFIANTGEKLAYGIVKATAATTTMEIHNLSEALNGVYGMAVNVPARNKALQLFMTGNFPAVNSYAVSIASAMNMTTGFEAGGSTTPPSITGIVTDVNFSPLAGARVRLERYVCPDGDAASHPNYCNAMWQVAFNRENLTDVGGLYSFYDVPAGYSYNLNVSKAGYERDGTYVSSTTARPVFLEPFQLALATYTLTGVLKYNGAPLPNANIMVSGDNMNYSYGTDSYRSCQPNGCGVRSDARVRTGADGAFTVTGLTDGNARVEASFEGGWRSLNYGNSSSNTDDLRITISSQTSLAPSTTTANGEVNSRNAACRPGSVWILNSSGTCVTAGSVVFNIIPEGGNSYGQLRGTLTFITTYTVTEQAPMVISTSSPLTLMAQQSCRNGCYNSQMGFTSLAGTFNSNTTSYFITLSTGVTYYPRVFSPEWAKASSFDAEVSPTEETPVVWQNISVLRAGSLQGVVKFPDGSSFKPDCSNEDNCLYSAEISLQGINVDVKESNRVNENGEFEFANLAPGTYRLSLRPRGTGFIWSPMTLDSVAISEGRTTELTMQLEAGLAVKPQIVGLPIPSTSSWGYFIIGVEAGEKMTQKKVTELFFSEPKYSFNYSTSTGWETKYMPAGQYDFYLILGAKYDPCGGGDCVPSYQQFANFIGRQKGKSVQKDVENPAIGTAAQPIPINIMGVVGPTYIAGTVQGANMFTTADLERMFANFNETFNIIPAVMLYDSDGDLRGFSNGMPNEGSFAGFEAGMQARDISGMQAYLAANALNYGIWGLSQGRYTAVFANPNYPPMAKDVTLPYSLPDYNFNFEDEAIVVGSISGVVKSSTTLLPLAGARVYLKHRTVEKFTLTNSSGAFRIENLPTGIYRLEVSRNGYVTAGEKTSLAGNDSVAFNNIFLLPSESKLSGRVFMSKFPTPVTKAGVRLVAYDETLNYEAPGAYLPKTEVQTDASGNYEIPGVVPGHEYKISAFYTGKLPEPVVVTALEGNTVISDITLKDVPPQIVIKVKKSEGSNKVDVIVKSPKQLISIPSCQYSPGGKPFNEAAASTMMLIAGPGNTYIGQFPASSSEPTYTVKFTAGDGSNKMVKEFVYDQVSNATSEQYIQEESLAGGEVQMDKETEEYSGLELDPGAITYSTTSAETVYSDLVGGFFSALPSVRTVKTPKGNLSVSDAIQDLMASEIYEMSLSNVTANKPFTLTLKYDKERAAGSRNLRIYQYDEAAGTWKEVPGNYTVDPMTGVVSVDVGGLTNASDGAADVTTPLGRKRLGMSARVSGRYVPLAAPAAQAGRFAVMTAPPTAGVAAYSTAFEVYNMPNPFNLKSKNVALSTDVTGIADPYPTTGTVIKYNLPVGKAGNLKFVIYNMAGEKVRTLDQGNLAAGKVYYSEWDGKNDNGANCASGVYFMLTFLDGRKLGGKAHKMAIIK